VDGKLTTVLGLACGMFVSLLFGTALKNLAPMKLWTSLAAASALIALTVAAIALMSKMWRLPSERDWFKEELHDSLQLRKYHVVSLLAAHQQRVKLIAKKSGYLQTAEWFVTFSALVIAGILFTAAF
jgi:hypothetical protein